MERKQIISNIVKKEKLREVQSNTLLDIKEALITTFGPKGSNNAIVHDNTFNEYSKDGHKVLSNIQYLDPLERSIQAELVELTRHIVKTVGDGTTSAIILSSLIFEELKRLETDKSPYEIIEHFKDAVSDIKKLIKEQGRDITLEDIYNIAYTSTNGNHEVASNLSEIYKEHGMDVFIDVGISNTTDSIVRSYDGLTLEVGYSDAGYINTNKGVSSIRNPRIYTFADPIDTPEMMAFFEKILSVNILRPYNDEKLEDVIPTVILAPKISRDLSSLVEKIIQFLYQVQDPTIRPPLLIISDIYQAEQYDDIALLCGCPKIVKYIDPKIQEEDVKAGRAPSIDNIESFYGEADLVEADAFKTKFINPSKMFMETADGDRVYSFTYTSILNFIEAELKLAMENKDNNIIGNLKRRLNSMKANMVDYLVGGITVSDRDSIRDLVEDAVLNCRSAARNGVGFGANYEGLIASRHFAVESTNNTDATHNADMYLIIYKAYVELAKTLYSTSMNVDNAEEMAMGSIENLCPFNLKTKKFDKLVLCTIDTDIVILDTISKIVTIMFTANQALVQSPMHNKYLTIE